VFLSDRPAVPEDREARRAPDAARLKERPASLAPGFNLIGEGPPSMQDREAFEQGESDPNMADMLIIDSAGGQTCAPMRT
jgi:CRISPR system Cascade subunit CasA